MVVQPPPPQKTTDEKIMEWTIPINRSPWAIAAGYVALFCLPFLIVGPLAIVFGAIALKDIAKTKKLGKGRALFAIIYGSIATLILLLVIISVTSVRN